MFTWFVESGFGVNMILTLVLIMSFFVMFMAPQWLREVGALAVLVAVLSVLVNARQLFSTLAMVDGEISPNVLYSGLKIYATRLIYGVSIAIVTVIERFFTKPRKYHRSHGHN